MAHLSVLLAAAATLSHLPLAFALGRVDGSATYSTIKPTVENSRTPRLAASDLLPKFSSPDASGSISFTGYDLSSPFPSEPLDGWTASISIKRDLKASNKSSEDDYFVGGLVALDPPAELVDDAIEGNGTWKAHQSWLPCMQYWTRGFQSSATETPFWHASPDALKDAPNGDCTPLLTEECISKFEQVATSIAALGPEAGGTCPTFFRALPDECTSQFGDSLSWDGPTNAVTASYSTKDWDVKNPKYDGSLLFSFTSELGEKGNKTSYEITGSQIVPMLFSWVQNGTAGDNKTVENTQSIPLAKLICLRADKAANGQSLPVASKEYLREIGIDVSDDVNKDDANKGPEGDANADNNQPGEAVGLRASRLLAACAFLAFTFAV